MARYRLASLDELGDYTISPTSDQTQLWNAIGRNAGSQTGDNYFTKRAKSIDNAIGTTGAAIAATAKDAWENLSTDTLRQERRNNMNDIARKYGYNSWDDWQDAYANAHQAGDTAKIAEMEPQLQEFQAQANTNAAKANEKAANYRDYMQNNDVSKRINQDPGKFLGSAINTLSTATDVLGLTNGPVSNAIQGGIEGIADELEQNGLQNFDWGRAGQNVAIGAATGGVVGGLNKGLTSALAKNGGNLFKGGNFVTRGLNDLGSKTALGRGISTIATGAGRGALSGAVGGATGAGLSSALNGVEIGQGFANALQGAAQGAGQGAFAGATMAGANMAINNTPGVGKFMKDVNQAQQDWQDSGDNFNERWNATRAQDTWGNRLINRGVEDVNAVKQGFQNVGEGLGILAERGVNKLRGTVEPIVEQNNRLALAGAQGEQISANNPMNENASYSLVKGGAPDGGDLVKADYVLPKNATKRTITKAIKDAISSRFQGNSYRIGDTGEEAIVNARTKSEMSYQQPNMSDSDFGRKGSMAGNLDELLENVRDARIVQNKKPDVKPGVDYYISGRVPVDLGDGEVYYPRVDVEVSGGRPVAYNIADIKKYPGATPQGVPFSGDQPAVDNQGTYGRKTIVPQNEQNVNKYTSVDPLGKRTEYTPQEVSRLIDEYENYKAPSVLSGNSSSEVNEALGDAGVALSEIYRNQNGGEFNPYSRADGEAFNKWVQDTKASLGGNTATPETEVYRTLTGESEPLRTSKEYEYRQKRNQKLLDQYGTIDKPTAKAVRAVETVGQIADAGFEKPAEVEAAIKRITGSDGTVNKLNRKVISNAGQVNTMDGVDPNTTIEEFIDQQVRLNGLYGTNDGDAVTTEIKAVLGQLPSRRNGTITGLDDAQDTFDVIQMLEKHGANYKGRSGSNYATSTPYKDQKAAVIDAVATVLKDRIYDASDISKVVTPEVISDMKSWYPENKKWATWVDDNIATAKTGADLRAAQAPFVRMGRLIENTIVNSGTFGSKVPRQLLRIATSNPLGVALNTAELLSDTPVGRRLQAWGYDKLADRAARKTATTGGTSTPTTPTQVPTTGATTTATEYNPATQIYNSIGRQEGLINGEEARTAQYLADATNAVASDGTLEGLVAPTTASSTSVYNSVYGTPSTGTTAGTATNYFPQTGDYWTDLLGRAMSSAIDADDADAFGSLYAMYQDALSKLDSKSSQKLTATQQRANAALNSLERLAQMTPDLGYNLSNIPVIGDIATFGGNDYESEAKSLAQQIGYMVSGANIKEEEAYNIGKAYVPQPFDSETTRRNKLQRAREIIAQYQNGYATE